jgi:hypothetical protein
MRTIPITIYRFDELPSDKAKQRAVDDYAALFGYTWADEAIASLRKLAEHFHGKLKDYSIDFFKCSYSDATFDMPDLEPDEIGHLLARLGGFNPETQRGLGDCVLTGYCADENAIDGFRKAFHEGERDLNKLMASAFASWLEDAQADCADFYSFEQFAEHSDANDYEYTASGAFYSCSGNHNALAA